MNKPNAKWKTRLSHKSAEVIVEGKKPLWPSAEALESVKRGLDDAAAGRVETLDLDTL